MRAFNSFPDSSLSGEAAEGRVEEDSYLRWEAGREEQHHRREGAPLCSHEPQDLSIPFRIPEQPIFLQQITIDSNFQFLSGFQ